MINDFTHSEDKFFMVRVNNNISVFVAIIPDYDNDTVTVGASIIDSYLNNYSSITLTLSSIQEGMGELPDLGGE